MVKNELKIAVVLNTSWNVFNFRLGLIKALIAKGHRLYAVAPTDEFVPEIIETGCNFIPVYNLSRKGVNPFKDALFCFELFRIYRREKFDVILHYTIKPNIYGSFAARFANIKSVSTVTGLGYSFLSDGLVNKIVKKLYKSAFKSAACVAFQNSEDKLLFESLNICQIAQTTLIKGSGIDTSYFRPIPQINHANGLVFLFVGRLLYDKGVSELFKAAAILKEKNANAEVWVLGSLDDDNPSAVDRKTVEQNEANGFIKYLGVSSDVRSVMQKADVVVLPSYREGLPRVMLESLAMAKPVITTNVAGCRDTVRDTVNGFLIPPKNCNALAEAMVKMCNLSLEGRELMGQEGRKMALKEFDEKVIVKRYFEEINLLSEAHK